jgi:hypothetical protein
MPKEDKKKLSHQQNSQKPIPFTSVGQPPFLGRRINFLHIKIAPE